MNNNVNSQKEWSFDSSLSNTLDVNLTDNEYTGKLVYLLQPILERRFQGIPAKQKIYKHRDRITFACPYCGDSMKSNYKKRGNFILLGKFANHFKCFNCGEFKRIDEFFKDYKTNLELDVINYISKGITDFSHQSNTKYNLSLFLDLESIEKYAIDRQEFLKYFNLVEVKDSPVWSWLRNRMQFDTSKFLYNPRKNHVIILNLTHTGKILGIQKRLFTGPTKYLTFKLSKIYELMGKSKEQIKGIPDEIDTISQIFNICLVDFDRPVTLFEGPLDSFMYKNSIANAGANKSFPIDITVRYWYDDDKTGIENSLEKINNGEYIFLWSKLKRDLELPQRKKWDLNDLIIYLKINNKSIPRFENYFSNDIYDIIDL